MGFYAGPLVGQKKTTDEDEESKFEVGPPVKKKKQGVLARIGDVLQAGSSPGKEFAERQKQREAEDLSKPVQPTDPQAQRRPMVEDLQVARQGQEAPAPEVAPEVAELKRSRQAEASIPSEPPPLEGLEETIPGEFDPTPNAQKPVIDQDDGTEYADYLKLLGRGSADFGKAAGMVMNLVDPVWYAGQAEKIIGAVRGDVNQLKRGEKWAAATFGSLVEDYSSEASDFYDRRITPAMKKEMAKNLLKEDKDGFFGYTVGEGAKSPAKILGMVVESIPSTVVGMGGSAKFTQMLTKTALKYGPEVIGLPLFQWMTKKYGVQFAAGVYGGAAGEGMTAAAQNMQGVYEQIKGQKAEAFKKSPAYKKIYESMSPDIPPEDRDRVTKEILALSGGVMVGVTSGLTTGALGAPSGGFMGKLLAGLEGDRLWRKILWGVVSEGLIEETPQSAMETVLTNLATKALVDPDKDIGEGVAEAAASGLVAGAFMGGGMVALSGQGGEDMKTPPKPETAEDMLKDAPDQTAEEILTGRPEKPPAADKKVEQELRRNLGSDSLDAEEAAAEFTEEELEAAAGAEPEPVAGPEVKKPAKKKAEPAPETTELTDEEVAAGIKDITDTNDYDLDTQDAGQFVVSVVRHPDGSSSMISRDGGPIIDHNAEFSKDKTDKELIQWSFEPLGVKSVESKITAPPPLPKKPRAAMPTTAKGRMDEGKAAQVGRIWGVTPPAAGGPRKAPSRTEPPWKRPPKPKKEQIAQVREIWKGKRAPRPGGVIEEISIPPAKTRITPTTKRKVFDDLAKKMGKQAGANVRFDNVIYQDERPIGLQMTVTSGPAKGATFTISDRAHKTIPRAQEFLDTIIMAYAKEGPAPGGPQKQLDALIKSLTPEQRASVLDLIKDPKMKPKEKLGLIQADIATLGQKTKLKKAVKPSRVETVKPTESTGKGEKGARKKAKAAAPPVKVVEAVEPETYQEAQKAIDDMKAELAGEGMTAEMMAVWPPLKELEALRDSFKKPAVEPEGGGRRAPVRTMPSTLPPKKKVEPEGGPRIAPVRTVESGLPIPKEVTNYYSGASRISDMKGHIAAGVPIGVEIAELSKNGEKELIQYLKDGGQVFIDSGAFGAFMNGSEVNWPAVLKNYLRIAKAAGEGAKNLVVVAPDVIGDPVKSYTMAEKYRKEINEIAALGTRIILPVHRPADDYEPGLRGVWGSMQKVMDPENLDRAIAGFPSNKQPIQPSEYEDIFKHENPPKTVHLLGISPKRKQFQEMVDELRRLSPSVEIIADANRLRSQAGRTLKPEIYSARAAQKANEGALLPLEQYQDIAPDYTDRMGDEYTEMPGTLTEDQIRAIAKDQGMPDGFVDEFITRVESGALGEAVDAARQQGEWAIEDDLDFKVFHDILSLSEEQIRPEMDRVDLIRRAVEWEKEKTGETVKPLESTGKGEKGARKKAKKAKPVTMPPGAPTEENRAILEGHDRGLKKILAQYFDDVSVMVGFPDLQYTADLATKREMLEKWIEKYFYVDDVPEIREQFDRLDKFTRAKLDQTKYETLIGGPMEGDMPADMEAELGGAAAQVDAETDIGEAEYHGRTFEEGSAKSIRDFLSDHLDYERLPEKELDTTAVTDGVGDFAGKMVYPLDDGRYYTAPNNHDIEGADLTWELVHELAVVPEARENEIEFYKEYEDHPALAPAAAPAAPLESTGKGEKGARKKAKKEAPAEVEKIMAAAIRLPDGTIIESTSHPSAMVEAEDRGYKGKYEDVHRGFVTSTGRYIDADEAAEIAKREDQVETTKDTVTAQDFGPYGVWEYDRPTPDEERIAEAGAPPADEEPKPAAIGQAKIKGDWVDISDVKPIKRGKDKGKYWAHTVSGTPERAKVELDELRGLDGGEFVMPGPPPPPPDIEAEIENLTDEEIDKMLDETGEEEPAAPKAELKPGDTTAYKGYLITASLTSGEFIVSKDNARIINTKSLADAKTEIDNLTGAEKPTKGPKAPPKERAPRKAKEPKPAKPLSEIIQEGAAEGLAGAEDALSGLYDLFGGTTKLSMGVTFDEDTYAKAKPKFQSAYEHMKSAGKSLKEFFNFFVERFGNGIKPYLRRFIQETKAAIAAAKKALGNFQNVGYVYDPEDLARGIQGKPPKTQIKIIGDKMAPANIWNIDFPEGASYGLPRFRNAAKKMFATFKDYVEREASLGSHSYRSEKKWETRVQNWLDAGHEISELQDLATQYGKHMEKVVNTFSNKLTIMDAVGDLQRLFIPPGVMGDGVYPDFYDIDKNLLNAELWNQEFIVNRYQKTLYEFLTERWQKYLAQENDILLSEIDIHNREKNKEVIRTGLPDYRKGQPLTKTEELKDPFGFSGVGFGTAGWIDQAERHRVVNAAFDAFKDLAAVIQTGTDKAMGLANGLAIQFANLGHKAKGAAAAYFPDLRTINFTRDNGDGTLAHEWSHGFHAQAPSDVETKLESLIDAFMDRYDWEAGPRLADEIMDPESGFMKRLVLKKGQTRLDFIKEEVSRRYKDAVKKRTDYYKTALALDPVYTARREEMWARAFEAWVYDTLPGTNNYLVNDFVEAGRIGGAGVVGSHLVYPAGQEREEFAEKISHFLDGVQWDADGNPSMKDDYVDFETIQAERLEQEKQALLDQIEERYKAIWSSEQSPDGYYWYRYDATGLGPMMQPDGYSAYDKSYKEEGQGGAGAVGYLTMLHPDDIIGYKLTNFIYDGDTATYIQEGAQDESELGETGEDALDEIPTRPGQGVGEAGEVEPGDQGERGESGGGDGRPGKERGETDGGEGDSDTGAYPATPGNYRITDESLNSASNVNDRFNANLAALKVLNQVEAEQRSATQKEKDILAGYTGWGGMSELFAWSPKDAWAVRAELVRAEMTDEELSDAEKSSVSSYYTPVPVARFMWKLAQRLGFTGGQVLDPAFGANGVFTGTMPDELAESVSVQGVEKDGLSSRIARALYEKASIEHQGFEDSKKPLNRYNLTITNVPFANYSPSDTKHNKAGHKLHNYYLNKMLDLTSPGGLAMAITTSNTMDKGGGHLQEFSQKAEFVGAIRLPSAIYSATGVVTDILVFRKNIEGSEFKGIEPDIWTAQAVDEGNDIIYNDYFIKHPDMIAGSLEKVQDRWGADKLRVVKIDDNIARTLAEKAAAFPVGIVETEVVKADLSLDDIISAPGTVKEGGLYLNDKDQVSEKVDGQEEVWPNTTPAEMRANKLGRQYIKILDQVRATLRAQKQNLPEAEIKAEQKELKKAYNQFVKKFGPLNDPKNLKIYVSLTDAAWVTTLETYDPDTEKVTKLADLFTKKIVGTEKRPDFANTDHDALSMALDEFGYPNLDYMAKLRGTDPDTVLKGVLDKVIENPETGILETMDEYLAGNVRRKLKVARSMAADNPEYERNVKLLEAALPDDIPAHRITARIGASWLKGAHIADFIKEKLKIGNELRPVLELNPFTGIWNLTFNGPRYGGSKAQTRRDIEKYKTSVEAKSVWGTPRASFFKLMADALAGKVPVVTYKVDKKVYVDEVATAGAVAKLQEIQAEFNRWLFADPARAEEAQVRFNDIVNTSTRSHYDGAHLTFPGKSMEVLTAAEAKELGVDDKMVFYDHQVNAVWQYLRNGNLYLAHEVGAGKTLTMAMIGMEAKRLKGKKKVLYVTLNDSTMGQAVEEIKRLYPLANVMPIQVSTVKERARKQLQKMALNDFDIAIMRQQDLNRIALSPEAEKTFIDEELMELREVLEEAKAAGSRIIEQDIQGRILALEAKLKAPGTFAEAKEAQEIYFDDIGVDLMIVDEAHAYKNIPFSTSLNRITGLNPAGSKTAQAFFRKAQWLNATQAKKDGIVLASGTPLTNSIAEFYNLQRALQPDEAKRQGQWRFDRWIANYGDIGAQLEWDGAGQKFKTVTTNRRIVNAGRLLATAFQNIDSVRAEDTDIARPVVYGGKPIGMTIQPNKYVIDYFENVVRDRVEAIEQDPKNAEYEGRPDNMLRIISNMSMVAIDQRLLNSKKWDPKTDTWIPAPGPYANTKMQKDSKIYVASRKIFERWKAEKKDKGVQLVFADMGVPGRYLKAFKYKTDEQIENMSDEKRQEYEDDLFAFENSGLGFNTYDGLKDELIKLGIPKNQIAFIHDADHSNKEKKAINLRRLFKKVNAGEVRVLIGSTTKAGTGVNVQKRVSDIHHLDVWWNYSAWEQRNGRGIRSGNIYTDKDGVRIFNYITEKSVDAHRWGKIFQKGKVLHSALSGDINIDVIEDISEEVMSAKEMEADASGNPLLRKQSELMDLVRTLGLERSSFLNTVRDAKNQLVAMPTRIETLESRIATQEKSKAIMEPITAVRFTGSDDILVLKKDGKKIADSLAAAVEKTRPVKDGKWWDKEKSEPTLVFGAHEEVEVERPVLDKDGNEQKDKDGKTKTKTVKEYKFKPVKAQALIESAAGDRARRWLTLKNGVTSNSYALADWSDALGEKKAAPPEITGNVSRSVTNFIANLDKIIGEAQDEIAELNGKKPALEEVAISKWPKENEYAQAEKDLAEVEAQMSATPGMAVEGARPVRDYKAPVPILEDFAEKDKWKTQGGYIWPKQEQFSTDPPAFMVREGSFDLKTFFGEQRKKFDPGYAYNSPAPASLFEADPGPEIEPPQEYTIEPAAEVEAVDKGGGYWDIIEAKTNQVLYEVENANSAEEAHAIFKGTRYAPQAATKFWIKSENDFYSIAPELWLMVERLAGPGTWHLGKDVAGENHIVHRDDSGVNDIVAEVRYEPEPPAAIKGEAGAPAPRAKKFAPATPQTVEQVKTMVDAVRVKWAKGAPYVKIYRTQEGLPQDVKDYLKANYKDAGLIAGAYYNNTIYLIAENLGSNAETTTTLLHEAFGHHGIRGILGNKIYPVLRDLYIAKKRDVDAIGATLGLDMKTTEGRAQAAEEWFAGQAQQEIESRWFDRMVRAIREWIRAAGIKLKLSDAEIRALIANARQFAKAGKAVEPIAGAAPAFRQKKEPPRKGKKIEYGHILTPEQKKRMAAAKGVGKTAFKDVAGKKYEELKAQRQHFPALNQVEDPKLRAQFADILRIHQEIPEVVKQQTADVMRGFIENLGSDAYDIYATNIILADMVRDIQSGLLNDALLTKGQTLPFGFESVADVETAYSKFQALAAEHTEIRDALAARKKYISKMVDGLVAHKILKKEVKNYDDYYHHQVLQYWGTKDKKKGNVATGSPDVRKHWRPWMVARKGSLLDYNTEYIEAEFVALSQQLAQLETARVLERLRKMADIKPELHQEATEKNLERFYQEAAERLSKTLKTPLTAQDVMNDEELDPLTPYRKKIGMARGALERMASKGELEAIDSGFDDVVQSLAQSFENKKDPENYDPPGEISDGKWFDFLAYLVRTGKPGSNWAATIFKNIHARKNQIRTDLGKNFLTWQQLVPEGYTQWKPEPGKGGFWVNTITDGMLRAVVAGEAELKEENVKQALAKGQELVWVLPTGLAETLDNFRPPPTDKALGQISEAALRAWKQYILINPMRVLKYNLNNMSGDLDIVLAYNPKILKGMKQSLRDLRAFDKGKATGKLKAELDQARKLGVIGSGWSVQEVEDITKQMGLDKFVRGIIMGEKPNLAVRWWEKSKNLTTLRENLLRLASFRHFQKEIAAGKTVYGASKPVEIDAIKDDTERAAKLARELVGDYGNISQSGQYLRKRMMPFWSWIEVNSPRYAYMLRNVRYEGREVGSRPLAIASKKAVTKAVGFGIKATMLYTLVQLWNMLLFPDEEKEFGEAGRRQLHLILGRRSDGTIRSVRFQGALSDTLSFFGLEDFPDDIKDLAKGKKTPLDMMKEAGIAFVTRGIHALRPEPKMLFETLTGQTTFPDPFSPRPIRDTTEHILRTFSLDKIYKRLIGRPGRGKNMAEHFMADLQSLVLYNSDPGEQAYYDARKMVIDYKEKIGEESGGGKPTNKGNALYYYKQALKYGDFKAAERYLYDYYYKYGGTTTGLKRSITMAHPLSGVKKMQRHKFRKSLTAKEAEKLERAIKWYREVYQRQSPQVSRAAMKRVRQQRMADRLED